MYARQQVTGTAISGLWLYTGNSSITTFFTRHWCIDQRTCLKLYLQLLKCQQKNSPDLPCSGTSNCTATQGFRVGGCSTAIRGLNSEQLLWLLIHKCLPKRSQGVSSVYIAIIWNSGTVTCCREMGSGNHFANIFTRLHNSSWKFWTAAAKDSVPLSNKDCAPWTDYSCTEMLRRMWRNIRY